MSSKPASRWGSLLQQAVAGVESRLDTILADEDSTPASSPSKKDVVREQPVKDALMAPLSARSSGELSRQSSTSKRNDRLQERLAKAVVARSAATKTSTSPERMVAGTSKPDSSTRNSEDSSAGGAPSNLNGGDIGTHNLQMPNIDAIQQERGPPSLEPSFAVSEVRSEPRNSGESHVQEKRKFSGLAHSAGRRSNDITSNGRSPRTSVDYEDLFHQMRMDNETAELRRQEETHQYMERIDALQAKLQYYMKEAVDSARKAAEEASAGSLEEKLAKKDEKIALLMEEGQKLSQNEMKHLSTIKKLRVKSAEDEKRLTQAERSLSQAHKAQASLNEKAKQLQKSQLEDSERLRKMEKDRERLKADLASRENEVTDLKAQLEQAKASAPLEDVAKYRSLLEGEKATTTNLREEMTTLQIEKKLLDDRHKAQMAEINEKAGSDRERARIVELELRAEIGALESRLETYRARAEEVSSGSSSDTQAKLHRQIETLQSQYSVASENWRGIESSLLARIATLEKDRDDLNKKETELRRKAREATHKLRRTEEELEQAGDRYDKLNIELIKEVAKSTPLREALAKCQVDLAESQKKLAASQAELKSLKEELRSHQTEADRREQQPLEVPFGHSRTPSPLPAGSKVSLDRIYHDKSSHHGRRVPSTPGLGIVGIMNAADRPSGRRDSAQVSQVPFPHRQDSAMSMSQSSARGSARSASHTTYAQTEAPDELFDGVTTPATPERTINDMFSASTAAAGPSIQLVERMSAAVRRLESEKAASKDELDRITAQRDEAREQLVALMREVEEKRALDKRVASLEAEVARLDERYQTTLEMLGEKSERVEELQADIADMKQIYKEALEKSLR